MTNFKSAKAFAKYMLRDNRLEIRQTPWLTKHTHGIATEIVIFRDGLYQVCLIIMQPNTTIENHSHSYVDTSELWIGGGGIGGVDGKTISYTINDGGLKHNLATVNKGVHHSGTTSDKGCVFLSFQKWDIEPTFLTDDWIKHE